MRSWLVAGSLSGALAVALGAFGAHGLKETLGDDLPTWQTAAQYHLIHTVMLLITAHSGYRNSMRLFGIGMLIFCGSLYLLAAVKLRWMGAIAPIGGTCLILGWIVLAMELAKEHGTGTAERG
ncbi:MAG: hypothetical protein HONBIEJF_02480 [Fimbriimonadaceae bacterium]|nr:hypothetical protein [Fimbriimonadaceae bacterium]